MMDDVCSNVIHIITTITIVACVAVAVGGGGVR